MYQRWICTPWPCSLELPVPHLNSRAESVDIWPDQTLGDLPIDVHVNQARIHDCRLDVS